MPFGAVQLKPGVDTQLTMSANQAGITTSQLIRYKEGLVQAYGGFTPFTAITATSTVRDIHAWQDIANVKHLSLGCTANLQVITSGSNLDITPQKNTTNNPPNFSISSGSNLLTVVDGGSSASTFDTVYFNTPVAIGAFLLNGAYPINSVGGSSTYTIALPSVSSATVTSSGKLPVFTTSSGSGSVSVVLSNNNFKVITGLLQQFIAPTSVGGLTIQGPYQIASVIDSTNFTINSPTQASSAATATMNGGNAQLVYYITIGPQPSGSGFGSGGFGSGGFGSGTTLTGGTGTPITAVDWTTDNWGEILLSCPQDGPIYSWSADSGFQNAQVITQAPFFNGGIFISMPQQILVAWRSTQSSGVQDPLIVRWSDATDYTNWTETSQTSAGSFRIPTGSIIVGGIQAPTQAVISTDVDAWSMNYVGGDVIFNFTRVGSGCGWVGSHACGVLAGDIYWMGTNNFFVMGDKGVRPMPCTVWDAVFQNLNSANRFKSRIGVNSTFNELTWFYPSENATENDSYVKVHIEGNEYEWDYGLMPRTAWIDISVLGTPIAADPSGTIWQHESGNTITGASLPAFQTGWWTIAEGQNFGSIDQVIPDFIWGTRSGNPDAQIDLTFFSADYPGAPVRIYGPYTVSQSTTYINVRIRGRLMSMQAVSTLGTQFWRLGRIRYRYAPSGRR